ncbi:lipopolysaccharide biosynthesis protein [Lysobacter sp. KIS68-7]|uniref:lipopolysaccharide biosynthesis protein n=1 Tax=Lysobacter sp. KIS68-7 TaxID=2904252 RepID=UPI001E36344F|nr:lipopolysaccharide biosynthesis protein [Lysobacter sp. KIS68-7]UHQ18464.1 lipopolysaccharide biosynthesis protein [Lysobacter sp. KIS68-7]
MDAPDGDQSAQAVHALPADHTPCAVAAVEGRVQAGAADVSLLKAPTMLRQRLASGFGQSLVVFAVKGGAGAASLLVFACVARMCGAEEFGRFGLLFSAAMFVASFAALGQQALLVKEAPKLRLQHDAAGERALYRFSILVTAIGALIGFVALVAWGRAAGGLVLPSVAAAALSVLFAISQTTLGILRVNDRLLLGIATRDLAWRLLALVGLVVVWRVGGASQSAGSMLLVVAAALLLAVLPHWQVIRRRLGELAHGARDASAHPRTWFGATAGLAVVGMIAGADQTLFTVALGRLESPVGVGAFFASVKVVEVVNLFMVSVALTVAPALSRAVALGDRAVLQVECRKAAGSLFLPVVAACLVLTVGAPLILGVFDTSFSSEANVLRILAAAMLVNALTGATGLLMQLAGMHWRLVVFQGGAILAVLACLPMLVGRFGVEGAALAYLASKVLWNVLALVAIRKRLGIDPSCLSLMPGRAVA